MNRSYGYPRRPPWLKQLDRVLAGGLLATWTLVAWPCCHAPGDSDHAATQASAPLFGRDYHHAHPHRDGHDTDAKVGQPVSDAPDICAMDRHHGDAAPGLAATATVKLAFASLSGVVAPVWISPPHQPAAPVLRIVVQPPPVSNFPIYLRVERLLI